MPNKTQEYLNLAQQTAKELTRYWENWTDYLTTASRLYKYNYADQLMIYAQRPDATACASFDLWNDRMNRYVRRGSKGIALLDQSSSVPRLHYVFDVSDTGVRRNSRDPEVWQLGPDLMQPVSEMLAREYGVHHENLGQQIADVCGKLVDSYWDNNSGDILDIVDGSLLMDYDEAGQKFQFKSAAAISITYTVLERCGFEPAGHFDRDDFQAIFSFSTPAAVYALGTAVSECSRDVLRNIERTVKTTIRRRNVERSQYEYEQPERDLLDHRGLPAPEPDPAPAGESTGQVRTTAPDLPDEASPGAVQLDAPVGDSASAPAGSGADRREPDAPDHAGTAETEPGSEQGTASDGVGAAHEQPESTGRGAGDERADLLVDVQAKLAEGKNIGYARWAKKYNLKEMSKTLIFLQEKKIGSIEEMQERVDAATARYHELGDSIKAAETRMTEIAVLRTHIVNYTKTRPVYDAYRKAGYSKRFLENHRAEITLHKAAKTAFDEAKLKKLPKVKELDAEYSKLLTEKKAAYPDYRKAKDEMQELLRAQRNVELFFAEEKNTTEKTQSR